MKLNLLTYNVRRLNDPASIPLLRHYLQGFNPKLDLLMLQEHKLWNKAAKSMYSKLWPLVKARCLQATEMHQMDQEQATGELQPC